MARCFDTAMAKAGICKPTDAAVYFLSPATVFRPVLRRHKLRATHVNAQRRAMVSGANISLPGNILPRVKTQMPRQ